MHLNMRGGFLRDSKQQALEKALKKDLEEFYNLNAVEREKFDLKRKITGTISSSDALDSGQIQFEVIQRRAGSDEYTILPTNEYTRKNLLPMIC